MLHKNTKMMLAGQTVISNKFQVYVSIVFLVACGSLILLSSSSYAEVTALHRIISEISQRTGQCDPGSEKGSIISLEKSGEINNGRYTRTNLLNEQDEAGDSPLHLALRYGCHLFAEAFLRNESINLKIRNNKGEPPYIGADGLSGKDCRIEMLKRMSDLIFYSRKYEKNTLTSAAIASSYGVSICSQSDRNTPRKTRAVTPSMKELTPEQMRDLAEIVSHDWQGFARRLS